MDPYTLMRTLGALGIVLGLLAGALWIVRRYNIGLPGRMMKGGGNRLEVIERTTLDSRRSVALLRRDGREHLILLSPEGSVMLETSILRDEVDEAAEIARQELQHEAMLASKAEAEAMRESFVAMVDKARTSVKDTFKVAQPMLEQVKARLPAKVIAVARPAAVAPASVPAPAPVGVPVRVPAQAASAPAKRAARAAKPRKGRQPRTARSSAGRARRG